MSKGFSLVVKKAIMQPDMKSITIALFLVLTNQAVVADTLNGRVVAVADGDTLTILDAERQQHKIRLVLLYNGLTGSLCPEEPFRFFSQRQQCSGCCRWA